MNKKIFGVNNLENMANEISPVLSKNILKMTIYKNPK